MQKHRLLLGSIAVATCLTMIACGDSQKRQQISDRTGARNNTANSKLLKSTQIVKECASESGKENETREILSLQGLRDSLTTVEASNLFASAFTSRIEMTDANNKDLRNARLSQIFLLDNGLQYQSGTLANVIPSLLPVQFENCERVELRAPVAGEEPDLLLQLARFSQTEIDQMVLASGDSAAETDTTTADAEDSTGSGKLTFFIDREASSENMLVLAPDNSNKRIIVKVLNEETLQVITTETAQYVACGQNFNFELRNEATVVWGQKWQEPVTIDRGLYNVMKAVSNKPELLDSGVQEQNAMGRRNNSGATSSVTLPVAFMGIFDESIRLFRQDQPNDFEIQPVACDNDQEQSTDPEQEEEQPSPDIRESDPEDGSVEI